MGRRYYIMLPMEANPEDCLPTSDSCPPDNPTSEESVTTEGSLEEGMQPHSVLLYAKDLEDCARSHGNVSNFQKLIGMSCMEGPDGHPAIVALFQPIHFKMKSEGEDAAMDEEAEEVEVVVEAPPSIEGDDARVYAMNLMAYLYNELRHDPPHMRVLDVMEHRHIMVHNGAEHFSGEVTACFRLFGDPDHYGEGRPKPPSEE